MEEALDRIMRALKSGAILVASLATMAIAGCQSPPDHAYCDVSRTGYQNALADVNQRLDQYKGCLSRVGGSSACSSEFEALSSSQSNLERGASDVQRYCAKSP